MLAISQKPCDIQEANQAGIDEAAEDGVEVVTGWSSKDVHSMVVFAYISKWLPLSCYLGRNKAGRC